MILLIPVFLFSFQLTSKSIRPGRQWPQYRGYLASGVPDSANIPETWNVPEGKNVRRKIEFASSPIIYNGVVIVQCDVLENSFVAALDAETGKEIWKANRDEYP